MRWRNLWLIMATASLLSVHTFSWADQPDALSSAAEDEKKLETVKKMFESPYAEEDYYRTDRLLITATGSQLPVHKAPAVASIITAEDIEQMGATSLDDILATVPGIHVGPSPESGYRTNYHIRGIYTGLNQQVLLLINGIPINTLYTGSRLTAFRMPTANISRVEIIRGPGSAVHGADAFAGTINVITKDVHEVQYMQSGFRADAFETYDAWLQGGGIWNGWELAVSVEYGESEGDDDRVIASDQQAMLDSVFGTNASLTPRVMDTHYKFLEANLALRKDNWSLRQRYWTNLGEFPYWAGATNTLSNGNELDVTSYLADLRYENPKIASNWEFSTGLNYLYQRSDFKLVLFPPGAVVLIGADGNLFTGLNVVSFPDGVIGAPERTEQAVAGDVSATYSGFSGHRLRMGLGAKRMELEARSYANFGPGVIDGTQPVVDGTLTDLTGTPYAYVPNESRQIWYIFAQDEWSFARHWDLTAGVRYDHYSDFGGTFNPRLALVWETRYDLTTKILYGRAFRPPSFQELYSQNNPATKGNPDLDPETIQTIELAFDYQPASNFRTIVNLFVYEAEDLIDLIPDAVGTGRTNQNARDQEGRGFELEMDWEITDTVRLRANYAFQASEDKENGEPVANTPQKQFYVNPCWTFLPNWSLDAQIKWIGDRERAQGDSRDPIDDYTLIGMTLRRKNYNKHWDFAVAISNLLNHDVREPAGTAIVDDYPMPGRSIYAEVRFHY
ncbi:MAG: TonB-dependent receptor [Desulfobacteraceae bacterium]|jgi:iron complex outermembrane receptor protein